MLFSFVRFTEFRVGETVEMATIRLRSLHRDAKVYRKIRDLSCGTQYGPPVVLTITRLACRATEWSCEADVKSTS
jgi:hypothetical protein